MSTRPPARSPTAITTISAWEAASPDRSSPTGSPGGWTSSTSAATAPSRMWMGRATITTATAFSSVGRCSGSRMTTLRSGLSAYYSEREEACCAAVYTAPFRTLSRNAAGQVVESPNLVLGILRDLGGTVPVGDPFVRQNSLTPGIDLTSPSTDWGLSAEVNWDLGPANLTSITAYRDWIQNDNEGFRFRHSGHRPASRLRSRLRDVQPGTEAAGQRVRWRPRLARRGLLCERDDRAGRLPQARRGRGAILQLRRRQGRCARADLQSRGADMLECASGSLPRLSGFCRPSGRVAAAEYRLGQ